MWQNFKKNFVNRFKEPSDVYSAVYPLYYLCTVFGLAPYTLVRVEDGRKIFKFAWWPMIRNGILVLILFGSISYHAIFQAPPFWDSDMKEKLRSFQEIVSSLLSCCAVIFGSVFAVKIIEVFRNIDEIDVSFRSLAVWVPYKNLYITILLFMWGLCFLVLAVITLNVTFQLTFAITNYSLLYKEYITVMTILLPYFINLIMELQYCQYLNILRSRYQLLNEYLETLVEDNPQVNGWIDSEIETISEKRIPNKAITKSMMAISDPVFIVDQAAALHIKLTDTAHMINYAFCVQQLLRITVAFVSIVTALFRVAVNFSRTTSSQEDSGSGFDYFFTAWAFSNACEVMAIVWITSETCEEANTCPRILHKIRNNTTNINLQDTIEIYSLQMYHNRLYFTVCGLFPLDYTLLYTIVAGVTTYLVILIQFNSTDFMKKNGTLALNGTAA